MFIILDDSFNEVAEITSFYSILWNRLYLSQSGGDFEIQLPLQEYDYIKKNYFIVNSEDDSIGIVNTIKKEDIIDDEIKQVITIKGEMFVSILKNRIIYPKVSKKGKMWVVIDELMNENIVSPSHSNRKIENFKYSINASLDKITSINVKGKTLAEVFESILSSVGCGMSVTFYDNKLRLHTNQGEDRSNSIVFCKEDNNIANFTHLTSNSKNYTHVIVEGKDDIYTTATYQEKKGIFRKETYLDKTNENNKNISEDDYKETLKDAGKSILLQHQIEEAAEFDVFLNNYEFGKDFNLGDIVTIEYNDIGFTNKVRVLGVLTSIDENGVKEQTITLGNLSPITLDDIEEDEIKDSEESESTTKIDNTSTLNTTYIPVYSKNNGIDKVVGGIIKLDKDTYLFNLTCNFVGDNDGDEIYYECDEDILKKETQIGINGSNGNVFIKCPGTKKDGKWYYKVEGYYSYFSLSKIVTRGTKETEDTPTIETDVNYSGMPIEVKAICSTWMEHYSFSAALVSPGTLQNYEKTFNAYFKCANNYTTYYRDGNYENLLFLDDYKSSLGSETKITFNYRGSHTPFIITKDEYDNEYEPYGYEEGLKNLIAKGLCNRVISDGYTYSCKEGETLYILYDSSDDSYENISIQGAYNEYGECFYYNPSNNYYKIKNIKIACNNGSLSDSSGKYEMVDVIATLRADAPDFKAYFTDNFNYEDLQLKQLGTLECKDYSTLGKIVIIKDVQDIYFYSEKAIGPTYPVE